MKKKQQTLKMVHKKRKTNSKSPFAAPWTLGNARHTVHHMRIIAKVVTIRDRSLDNLAKFFSTTDLVCS
jgi:hypothetical protein